MQKWIANPISVQNLSKSQLFNNKTLLFLLMNSVKDGSDPSYIFLKNETVWIQSEKAFYSGSSII